MGRKFQYDMSAEHLEELYQTEMDEEAKNIWSCCIQWLISYFHCSKQLADVRLRAWLSEYKHNLMKTQGLSSINRRK